MAFSEVYKSFLQETIEDPWPLLVEHFFYRGIKDLWYLFLSPIMESCERLRLINPNFPRFVDRFDAVSSTLYEPINKTTFDFLLRKVYFSRGVRITRGIMFEEYGFFLRDLGFILEQTQQEILSAHSRRALNDICKNALENVDKIHSRLYDTLRLLSEWPYRLTASANFKNTFWNIFSS